MEITEYTIIGVLDAISRNRTGRLIPILKYGEDNEPIRLGNVGETFQKRGNVVWFHVPPIVDPWTVWTFQIRESPTFNPDTGRSDKYAVDGTPQQINDIVIGNFESPEEARNALERGIALQIALPRRSYVVVGGDRLIGPIELQAASDHVRLKSITTDPQVDVRTLNVDKVMSVEHAGRRWSFLFPTGEQGELQGQLDWGDATSVLRRALRLVEKFDSGLLEDLQLTDKLMRRLSEKIASAELNMLDRSRIERGLEVVSRTIVSKEIAQDLQSEILALPGVHQMLESDREQARAAGTQDALRNAAEQLERYRGELQSLEKDVARLQQQRSELEIAITTLRDNQRRVADELDEEIRKRVEQAAESPGKTLAELVMLRPFLRQLGNSAAEGPVVPSSPHECRITDDAVLRERVDAAFRSAGIPVSRGREIHAALFAGLIPCVIGPTALKVVEAYASAGFCESALEITMNAGLLSPDDVLDQGKTNSLRSFLSRARTANVMHLAVFEGANRSLLDSALLPLLRATDNNNHFTQTFGPWPGNVLPVVTLVPSVAALTIPLTFWDLVVVVDTNTEPKGTASRDYPATIGKVLSYAVTDSSIWAKAMASHAVVPEKWRGWFEKTSTLKSLAFANIADRFEAAIRTIEHDEVRVVGTTLACCLGAVIARLPDREREAVMAFPTFNETLQTVCRDVLEYLDVGER